jgi:hypothetical protein
MVGVAKRRVLWLVIVLTAGLVPAGVARAAPGWRSAGNMAQARLLHRATTLPDGRVLVTGGTDAAAAAAELFNPMTGAWAPAGTLAKTRSLHTATLLPDTGEVVVIGAADPPVEIYSVQNGNWRMAGALITNRLFHTATRLPSGKVLVTGGWNAAPPYTHFASAELFDPATGMFTATGSLAVGRRGHVAVLLTSGKVLVAAGTDGAMGLTSAELYDPADGRFSPTGSLLVGRGVNGGRIQAVLLASGEVLVPGAPPDPSEIYSPATGTWRAAASMNEARIGYAAALLPSGRVLVAGGSGSPGALRSGEIYDPAANRWSPAGVMAADRALPASAVLAGGAVLVTGGGVGEKSAEIYEEEPPAPPDQGPDAGPSDAAADLRADMSVDSTTDGPGAGGADSAARDGADASRTDAGSGSGDSGCDCRMGGARSERETAAVGWLLAVAVLGRRCRRRRSGPVGR